MKIRDCRRRISLKELSENSEGAEKLLRLFAGAEIGNDIKSSNSFILTPELAAIVGTPVKLALSRMPSLLQLPPPLCCTCSLGEVRTLSENSAYSTSFSPDIVSSPNSLSSSELSWILLSGWHIFLPLPCCCESSSESEHNVGLTVCKFGDEVDNPNDVTLGGACSNRQYRG